MQARGTVNAAKVCDSSSVVWLLQYSCLVSQLARKTQSGMEEIDPEEELVSIWAKSGTKEVSSLDM